MTRNEELHRLWSACEWEALGKEMHPLAILIADEIWQAGYLGQTEVTHDELQSLAFEGLMVAIHAWKPGFQVPIATYASIRIRWFISQEMRAHSLQRSSGSAPHISLDTMMTEEDWEEQDEIFTTSDPEGMLIDRLDFARTLEAIPQPGRDILLETLQGKSLRQIAKRHRVSFITIRKHLKQARAIVQLAIRGEE